MTEVRGCVRPGNAGCSRSALTQSGVGSEEGAETDVHSVHYTECEQVFLNRPLVVIDDPLHSAQEPRFVALGCTDRSRRLVVVFTVRDDLIRVISARDMSRRERTLYAEQGAEDPPVQDRG